MGEYRPAAVCRRGHVATSDATLGPFAPKCPTCGGTVLTECQGCGGRIRGRYVTPGVARLGFTFTPSDFCDLCGAPHPWASRQARLYELENLLDEEPDMSEADRLAIRDQLEALRSPDLSEAEETERWTRIKKLAPGLIESGRTIITATATAAVQKKLGLS